MNGNITIQTTAAAGSAVPNGGYHGGGDHEEPRRKKKRRRRPAAPVPDHITILGGDPLLYQCKLCQKKFKSKYHISYHEFCGGQDKPFKCGTCGKGFITKGHYQDHLLLHKDEPHYKCPHCDKGFNLRGNWNRHIRVHTGERPYVCQQCPNSYMDWRALKHHIMSRHSDTAAEIVTNARPRLEPIAGPSRPDTSIPLSTRFRPNQKQIRPRHSSLSRPSITSFSRKRAPATNGRTINNIINRKSSLSFSLPRSIPHHQYHHNQSQNHQQVLRRSKRLSARARVVKPKPAAAADSSSSSHSSAEPSSWENFRIAIRNGRSPPEPKGISHFDNIQDKLDTPRLPLHDRIHLWLSNPNNPDPKIHSHEDIENNSSLPVSEVLDVSIDLPIVKPDNNNDEGAQPEVEKNNLKAKEKKNGENLEEDVKTEESQNIPIQTEEKKQPFECWICEGDHSFHIKTNFYRHVLNVHRQSKEMAKMIANKVAKDYYESLDENKIIKIEKEETKEKL